jgi:hypothetical protein
MAKEIKNEEPLEGEEIAEAIEPTTPPPKKKTKKEGELPLLLIIGGALGGVVLIILSVVVGTIVANKLFPPYLEGIETAIQEVYANMEKDEATSSGKNPRRLSPFPDEDIDFDGSQLFAADEDWFTFSSGRITANVKNSTSMYLIVDVAIDYKLFHKEELIARGFAVAGGKNEPPKIDTNSALYQRLKIEVASKINDFAASYSEGELQAMRLNFGEKLKEELKPTFQSFGLQIGKINVPTFNFGRQ